MAQYFLLIALVLAVTIFIAAPGSLILHWLKDPTGLARWRICLCVTPGLILLGLFYSLVWHMHRSLGAWPNSIGERGFSLGLLAHAYMANLCFTALLLATIFGWPAVLLVFLLVRSWRRWTVYLGIYWLFLVACVLLTRLAPSPFLNWWDD